MQTSGVHILKTLFIFGLLAGIGIMEAISAAASDSVEQEVYERVGLLGGLCVPARSQGSNRPCARTEAPGRSPVGPSQCLGHGGCFIPDEFWRGLAPTSHRGRFLIEVQES